MNSGTKIDADDLTHLLVLNSSTVVRAKLIQNATGAMNLLN